MKKQNRKNGFSLVELMIALTLGIFLLGSVLGMYLAAKTTSNDSAILSRIQENVRFASDYVIRDIRNAGFDDVGELVVAAADEINSRYLAIDDSSTRLSIRYAGRGHCAQRFDTFRVVQNTYFLSDSGELSCTGETWDETTDTFVGNETVALVSGIDSLSFQTICRNQDPCGPVCSTDLADPCVGARVRLNFQGLRPVNATDSGIRSVELVSGLRNSVLKVLYQSFIEEDGSS